jgi:hypothetical protein
MVTLKLADLGESMLLEVDETTGEFVFFRANQVIADVDNVTLTVRSGDAYPCPLIAGGVSLDLINTAGASARPILGGAFSGSGLLEGCGEPCPADVDQDGAVGGSDLGLLIATWGGTGSADIDGDGVVSGVDLGIMLTGWGLCP